MMNKSTLWKEEDEQLYEWLSQFEQDVDRDFIIVRLHQLLKQTEKPGDALKAAQMLLALSGEILSVAELRKPLASYNLQELILVQNAIQKELPDGHSSINE